MPNRYISIQTTKNQEGRKYYVNNIYPDILPTGNDIYVITTLGDRLDLLAYQYYKDTSLWWIIASANALPGDSLSPPVGIQLRIPSDIQSILGTYGQINRNR
jgi:hypothetical protein